MSVLDDALITLGLPAASRAGLTGFVDVFQKWNRRINLSAAREPLEVHDHIVDCLHLVPHLRAAALRLGSSRFLDVGAGGGFPSVVVAICMPTAHIVALEPVHKKHAFLRTVARELALANLEPRAERLEDHPEVDFDAAMSRATFDLRSWLLLAVQRLRPGGVAFGFEAAPRSDLPPDAQRLPYALLGKTRAIVALQRAT